MNKILNKWYLGLIIIPVIVNYMTETVQLPDLFKNWTFTIIGILIIIILILSYELFLLTEKIKLIKNNPKESDKTIIKDLLKSLDIDSFQDKIKEQDSWYGYEKDAIGKTFDFAKKADLISYKTSDKELNRIISELKNAIDNFNNYSSTQLYSNGKYFAPAKDFGFNIEKAKQARPIMNEKADFAFNKLTKFLDYIKTRNYLE